MKADLMSIDFSAMQRLPCVGSLRGFRKGHKAKAARMTIAITRHGHVDQTTEWSESLADSDNQACKHE
jgi:hypothetical protein